MEEWKLDLKEWEYAQHWHGGNLEDDILEIENFCKNPMFDNLTTEQKETMKANLVSVIKQVC